MCVGVRGQESCHVSGECLCSRLCQSWFSTQVPVERGGVADKKGGGVNHVAKIKQDLSFEHAPGLQKSGFQIIIILRPGRD